MNPQNIETKIEGNVPRQHMRLQESLNSIAGFHGNISSIDAEQILLRCNVGAYLIREWPTLGKLFLCIHDCDSTKKMPHYVNNFIIRHGDNDNVYIEENCQFKSIAELVDTYASQMGNLCRKPMVPCRTATGGQDARLDEHYPRLPNLTILPNDVIDTGNLLSFLIAGNELIRVLPNKKRYRRYFSINSEMTEIRWTPSCKKDNQALVHIISIKDVRRTPNTDDLNRQSGLYQDYCAFAILLVNKDEPMRLIARTPFEADVWVEGLTRLIKNTDRAADNYMLSAGCSLISYMKYGTEFIKLQSKGRECLRVYWLTSDNTELRWKPTSKAIPKARVTIVTIKDVRTLQTEVLNTDVTNLHSCSFSIIYGACNKTLTLVAKNPHEADIWVTGLRNLIGNGTEISTSKIAGKMNVDTINRMSPVESNERLEQCASDVIIYQNQIIIDRIKKELHDGRIVEMNMSIVEELKCRHTCDMTTVMEGQFGCIYFSRGQVPGFNLRVALKEINLGERSEALGSITNSKIAARLMHFAVVPLLAYFDDKTHKKHYFLSPFFDNGDLFKAIQNDTLNLETHNLTWKTRVKIMHQLASGIHYMHTGNIFRGTILHNNITSKNIVLDAQYNARLIDFGLARELSEGNEGYFPTVKNSALTKQHDYHNLGVVLVELVTGLQPKGCEELRHLSIKQIEDVTQVFIWTVPDVALDVANIAVECIRSVQYDHKITSDHILAGLQNIVRLHSIPTWDTLGNARCDLCLVNTRVNDIPDGHDLEAPTICSNRISTCCSCLRNSYINPIQCHTCGQIIKPFISAHSGAILVAGFDNDRGASNVFKSDIIKFKEVITSKILPAMCLEDENVIVVQDEVNVHSIVKTIDSAIDHMSRKDVRTLIFVYSGHNGKDGLRVGEQEHYTMDMLSKKLNAWKRSKASFQKFIAIFDCCEPEALELDKSLKVIQLNATGLGDEAYATRDEGSLYLKCIIQACTANATAGRCEHQNCRCVSHVHGEFITIDKLLNCIDDHRQSGHLGGIIPTENFQNINIKNEILAYNYSLEVVFRFTLEWPILFETNKAFVPPSMLGKFDELKRQLTEDVIKGAFGKEQISYEIKTMLGNIMRIEIDTGPKIKHIKEIDTAEMLSLAWISRRQLRCTFRRPSDIARMKPAGHFLQEGKRIKALHEQFYIEQPGEFCLEQYIGWFKLCERRDNTKLLNEYIEIIMILQRKKLSVDERLEISFVELPKGFTCAYMKIVSESSHL